LHGLQAAALHGLQGLQAFLAEQGLHGLQAAGFAAEQGLHAAFFAAAQGLHGLQAAGFAAAHGLQAAIATGASTTVPIAMAPALRLSVIGSAATLLIRLNLNVDMSFLQVFAGATFSALTATIGRELPC